MFCFRVQDSTEKGWHVNLEIQSFYVSKSKLYFKIQNQIGWYT